MPLGPATLHQQTAMQNNTSETPVTPRNSLVIKLGSAKVIIALLIIEWGILFWYLAIAPPGGLWHIDSRIHVSYESATTALERMKDWMESVTHLQTAALAALAYAFSKSWMSSRNWHQLSGTHDSRDPRKLAWWRLVGFIASTLLLTSILLATWIMDALPSCQAHLTKTGQTAEKPAFSVLKWNPLRLNIQQEPAQKPEGQQEETRANSFYHFVVHGHGNIENEKGEIVNNGEFPMNLKGQGRDKYDIDTMKWLRLSPWSPLRPYLGPLNGVQHIIAGLGGLFFAIFIIGAACNLKDETAKDHTVT